MGCGTSKAAAVEESGHKKRSSNRSGRASSKTAVVPLNADSESEVESEGGSSPPVERSKAKKASKKALKSAASDSEADDSEEDNDRRSPSFKKKAERGGSGVSRGSKGSKSKQSAKEEMSDSEDDKPSPRGKGHGKKNKMKVIEFSDSEPESEQEEAPKKKNKKRKEDNSLSSLSRMPSLDRASLPPIQASANGKSVSFELVFDDDKSARKPALSSLSPEKRKQHPNITEEDLEEKQREAEIRRENKEAAMKKKLKARRKKAKKAAERARKLKEEKEAAKENGEWEQETIPGSKWLKSVPDDLERANRHLQDSKHSVIRVGVLEESRFVPSAR